MEEIWGGWPGYLMLVTGGLVTIAVVAMLVWQVFSTLKTWLVTRVEVARNSDYRQLVQRSVDAQEALLEGQQRTSNEISQIRASLANLERMLNEID